ncbi:MAG: CDP-glycerol glycerophosphotransferase family protein [Janthinobacterium lividum]
MDDTGTAKNRRYSVVSAVYGAENYLDDFFRSLTRQTLDFTSSIQLVMVDDGSIDRSAEIIRRWQAKHPGNIVHVYKQNGGQASARNLGLQHATGDWLTFIDPDDFVAPDYFQKVEETLASVAEPIAMVACKLVFYYEKNGRYADRHPLRSLFSPHPQLVDLLKSRQHIQLSASSAFFRKKVITDHALTFDGRIQPSFEDAHFVNRYLSHTLSESAAFLGNAKYFYRKRKNENSSIDTSWDKPSQYREVLEFGVLDMLHHYKKVHGAIPAIIQRTALYQVIWYVKRLLNKTAFPAGLPAERQDTFRALLVQIFEHIDVGTISSFDLAGMWFYHRVGLMNLYKKQKLPFQIVYVSNCDPQRRLFQLQYFSDRPAFEAFHIDGVEVIPPFETVRTHTFVGMHFVEERTVWLPLTEKGILKVTLAGAFTRLSLGGQQRKSLPMSDICRHFEKERSAACNAGPAARLIKYIARLGPVRRHFAGAWALMDRNTQADDNGEHLYRYIARHEPQIKAFYVLDASSHDWDRLRRDGFRLVPFGSLRHKLLLLNCAHLVTSHIDAHIIHALPQPAYKDRLRFRLTFLQHGVTTNDMSQWLNVKNFALLVASGRHEYQSLSGPGQYKFSSREVRLLGFPRHDTLFDCGPAEKTILIMPTWRQSLAGPVIPGTGLRAFNPAFIDSDYFREWRALLHDTALLELAAQGYRSIFFPHANMQRYIHLFDVPPHVEVLRHVENSIQDLFRAGAVMITDYSSVACEFGFMQKPVIYFQFDRKTLRDGDHLYKPADYSETGFGPVVDRADAVMATLRDIVGNDCVMPDKYKRRSDDFFGFRDANSCQRVVAAIRDLDRPVHIGQATPAYLLQRVEQAYDASIWSAALQRCAALHEHPQASVDERRRASLLQAFAELALKETPQNATGAAPQRAAQRWRHLLERTRWDAATVDMARRALFSANLDNGDYPGARETAARLPPPPSTGSPAFRDQARFACLAAERNDIRTTTRVAKRLLRMLETGGQTTFPGSRDVRFAVAHLYAKAGDVFKARGILMQLLRADARDARCAAKLGEWLERCVDRVPQDAPSAAACDPLGSGAFMSSCPIDVALHLAAEARLQGDLEDAAEMVTRLLAGHPYDAFVQLEAGELALACRRWEDAAAHFHHVRHAAWSARVPRVARGLLLAREHLAHHADSADIARTALAAYPGDHALARAATSIALREARWDDAEASLPVALELASHTGIEQRVAVEKLRIALLRATGRLAQAQAHLASLIRFEACDHDLLLDYADLAFTLGQWHAAIDAWKRLEDHEPVPMKKSALARKRAQAHWWAGERGSARQILEEALESHIYAALARDDIDTVVKTLAHSESEIDACLQHGQPLRVAPPRPPCLVSAATL